MYRQQIAKKTTPSLASTPITKKTRPTPSYGSLSGMIQRATANPDTLRRDEWRHLDGAVGTRATQEIKTGKRTSYVPEFKGISAQLGEASTELTYSPIKTRVSEIKDTRPQETSSAPIQAKEAETANKTGLPDRLKTGIETLSGYSMDDVKVHYNSAQPAKIQAYAYAQGTDIHIAPGQEKHLPHEAWHIVQQKQGRVKPTHLSNGVPINNDRALETEADFMVKKAAGSSQRTKRTINNSGEKVVSRVPAWTDRVRGATYQLFKVEDGESVVDSVRQEVPLAANDLPVDVEGEELEKVNNKQELLYNVLNFYEWLYPYNSGNKTAISYRAAVAGYLGIGVCDNYHELALVEIGLKYPNAMAYPESMPGHKYVIVKNYVTTNWETKRGEDIIVDPWDNRSYLRKDNKRMEDKDCETYGLPTNGSWQAWKKTDSTQGEVLVHNYLQYLAQLRTSQGV